MDSIERILKTRVSDGFCSSIMIYIISLLQTIFLLRILSELSFTINAYKDLIVLVISFMRIFQGILDTSSHDH